MFEVLGVLGVINAPGILSLNLFMSHQERLESL